MVYDPDRIQIGAGGRTRSGRVAVVKAWVRGAAALAVVAVGGGLSTTAGQDGRSSGLVVCYPNAPGSTDAARPVMERLGAHLTWRTGFDVQPVYTNDGA